MKSVLLILLLACTAWAGVLNETYAIGDKGSGNGHSKAKGAKAHGAGPKVFLQGDRDLIRHYLKNCKAGHLPPGLEKRGGGLPPGLEKHLVRNGVLPPGLQKKIQPIPFELEQGLVPLPAGLSRGFIAGRVVLFDESLSMVLDVFVPF